MHLPWKIIGWLNLERRVMKLKKIANPHGIIVGLLAGLLVIQLIMENKYPEESQILGYVIVGIAIMSALFKFFASWLATLWMAFGMLLGKINGAILLTLVYFLILTPLSWLKKVFSPSTTFKPLKEGDTRFINRDHTYSEKDIQHPW